MLKKFTKHSKTKSIAFIIISQQTKIEIKSIKKKYSCFLDKICAAANKIFLCTCVYTTYGDEEEEKSAYAQHTLELSI